MVLSWDLSHPVFRCPVIELGNGEFQDEFPISMDWFKGKSTGTHGFSH
jgi:hypothetical protein